MEVRTKLCYMDKTLNRVVNRKKDLHKEYAISGQELTCDRIDELLEGNETSNFQPLVEVILDDFDEVAGATGGGAAPSGGFVVEEYNESGYPLTVAISDMNIMPNGTSNNFLGGGKLVSCIETIKVTCAYVGGRAFEGNNTIKKAIINDAQNIFMYCFNWAKNLERVDITSQQIKLIAEGAFANTALNTLIVRAVTPPTLENDDALSATPIANGTGFIYVPDESVDAYKAKWSTYAAQIKGISELAG